MIIAELIGVFLVGYGMWFTAEGIKRHFGGAKDWWRPVKGKRRYPYPIAGALLGVCFADMGLVFALHNLWAYARSLVWVGVGLFVLVLATGIGQPRFLHPRWYGELEDRYGKKGLMRLKREAFLMEEEEWQEIASSESAFKQWVGRTMPHRARSSNRGYERPEEDE